MWGVYREEYEGQIKRVVAEGLAEGIAEGRALERAEANSNEKLTRMAAVTAWAGLALVSRAVREEREKYIPHPKF